MPIDTSQPNISELRRSEIKPNNPPIFNRITANLLPLQFMVTRWSLNRNSMVTLPLRPPNSEISHGNMKPET